MKLTRTEIMAASDAELDALMATEIMGWSRSKVGTVERWWWHNSDGNACHIKAHRWHPAAQPGDIVRAQNALPKGQPRRWYIWHLMRLLDAKFQGAEFDPIADVEKIAYASPRDRCRAMLLAKLEKWDE